MAALSKISTAPTYDVTEVAEAWEVSRRTVYRWISEGRLVEGKDYERTPGGPSGRSSYRLWGSSLPAAPKGTRKVRR